RVMRTPGRGASGRAFPRGAWERGKRVPGLSRRFCTSDPRRLGAVLAQGLNLTRYGRMVKEKTALRLLDGASLRQQGLARQPRVASGAGWSRVPVFWRSRETFFSPFPIRKLAFAKPVLYVILMYSTRSLMIGAEFIMFATRCNAVSGQRGVRR